MKIIFERVSTVGLCSLDKLLNGLKNIDNDENRLIAKILEIVPRLDLNGCRLDISFKITIEVEEVPYPLSKKKQMKEIIDCIFSMFNISEWLCCANTKPITVKHSAMRDNTRIIIT